jgi:hypothetical protein
VTVAQNIPFVIAHGNLGQTILSTTSQYMHAETEAQYEHFTDTPDIDNN